MGSPQEKLLPSSVRRLAGEVLHSISELDIALLARAWPDQSWTAAKVSRRLRIGHVQAQAALARLVAIGMLEGSGSGHYRYAPATEDAAEALDALAVLYRSHRQAIERLVLSRSKGPVSYFPPGRRSRLQG